MGIVLQFRDDFFIFSGVQYIQFELQVTMNLTAAGDKSKIDGSLLIRGLILTLTGDPYLLTLYGQFFLEHFL